MPLTITGGRQVQTALYKRVAAVEKKLEDKRRMIAAELTEELMRNIPVWSGRTIASMTWTNNGKYAPRQPHPQRGGFKKEGPWHYEPAFGPTSTQPLGAELQRPQAEAAARATLGAVSYSINQKLSLTINSVAWSLVEVAKAGVRGRNIAVVSAIAMATIKARYGLK